MSSFVINASPRSLRGSARALICGLLLWNGGMASADSHGTETRISIWDREVPGTNRSYAEVSLGDSPERFPEPAQLPLPAPVLAAGLGLVGAYLIKKRISRS